MKFTSRELILFLAVLMVPILSYFVVFKPQSEKIDQAKTEIEHRQERLATLRTETSRNDDLRAANEDIGNRSEEMDSLLPSGKEIDLIVRQVSALAVESGLSPPTLKSEKPVAAARFREQPLKMSTSGSFEGFYEFLLALERLPRLTRVVDLMLKDSNDDGVEVDADFTLSIYFQTDEGEAS